MNTLNDKQAKEFAALTTKSSKIRYLDGLKWTRGEISKFMEIRYQHVRNVLTQPLKKVSK